jgi:hypothetical protein
MAPPASVLKDLVLAPEVLPLQIPRTIGTTNTVPLWRPAFMLECN